MRSSSPAGTPRPRPVAIVGFMTNKEIYWGRMAAAGTVVLVPVLAFGIVAHRHLVRGLVSGSGK